MAFASPAADHMEKPISVDEMLRIREPSIFLFRMDSAAMSPTLNKGDLCVFDRAITPRSGQIVVAAVDGESMCRRYVVSQNDVSLVPDHPACKTRFVLPGDELFVVGVVIGSVRIHE